MLRILVGTIHEQVRGLELVIDKHRSVQLYRGLGPFTWWTLIPFWYSDSEEFCFTWAKIVFVIAKNKTFFDDKKYE